MHNYKTLTECVEQLEFWLACKAQQESQEELEAVMEQQAAEVAPEVDLVDTIYKASTFRLNSSWVIGFALEYHYSTPRRVRRRASRFQKLLTA